MYLLTTNQTKMLKAEGTGFISAALHLEPAHVYKGVKTCRGLHGKCAARCIAYTGRGRFEVAVKARLRRTHLLIDDPDTFLTLLDADALAWNNKAARAGVTATIRPNCTSDLLWEAYRVPRTGLSLFDSHPKIRWYDYTKDADRVATLEIPNYDLTYSWSERSTIEDGLRVLDRGKNIAVVFDVRKGCKLPAEYKIGRKWVRVIDGDLDDLRLSERDGRGIIVGLRYKQSFSRNTGKAVRPDFNFVQTAGGDHVTA